MKRAYILLLRALKDFSKRIGSLGRMHFEKGNCAHVGSAQASLFPKFERHYWKKKKHLQWHIDYLTTSSLSTTNGAIYAQTNKKEVECLLSSKLAVPPFSKAVPRFGSTDWMYGCMSHLCMLKTAQKLIGKSVR